MHDTIKIIGLKENALPLLFSSRVRLMAISYVNWRIKQRGSRKDNLPH